LKESLYDFNCNFKETTDEKKINYFRNRVYYLELFFYKYNFLSKDFIKYFLYQAIKYKDYKIAIILLRLGVNPYQEIDINGITYRIIDFADAKLKSILKLMKNEEAFKDDSNE